MTVRGLNETPSEILIFSPLEGLLISKPPPLSAFTVSLASLMWVPLERASGLGRLYAHFLEAVQALGCYSVRCVTSPANTALIAFHRRLSFKFLTGDTEQNNVPVHTDYDGLGGTRVLFRRDLQRS